MQLIHATITLKVITESGVSVYYTRERKIQNALAGARAIAATATEKYDDSAAAAAYEREKQRVYIGNNIPIILITMNE